MSILVQPSHIDSLADHLLVQARVRTYGGKKSNSKKGRDYSLAEGAKTKVMNVQEELLPEDEGLHAIGKYRQTIDNWLRRVAYPWGDGLWLLPAFRIPDFMKEWEQVHKPTFLQRVDDWIGTDDKYEALLRQAAWLRQASFNRADYPTREQMLSRFSIDLYTFDVPKGDFRCQVSQDLADNLRKHYEQQTRQMLQEVLDKQAAELVSVITSIRNGCDQTVKSVKDDDGTVKTKVVKGRIYEVTLERARELCETFQRFNLTGDQTLAAAANQLQQMLTKCNDMDTLRDSFPLRAEIKSGCEEILGKFGM